MPVGSLLGKEDMGSLGSRSYDMSSTCNSSETFKLEYHESRANWLTKLVYKQTQVFDESDLS